VFDGAGWKNTLGFYTYNQNHPPTQSFRYSKTGIVSKRFRRWRGRFITSGRYGEGRNRKIPAGTVIGFYLVSQGWQDGILVDGRYTHYTSTQLNSNHNQQHTLFTEKECGDIVMTWEDIDQDDHLSYQDNDFNDLMFTISDNPDPKLASTAFDLTHVTKL